MRVFRSVILTYLANFGKIYFKVESKKQEQPLTFKRLHTALIALVNSRIRNGDYTERGLARILGVSQPQIHNVLKGARKLTSELGDRILLRLSINMLELLDKDTYGKGLHRPPLTAAEVTHLTQSARRKQPSRQNSANRSSREKAS